MVSKTGIGIGNGIPFGNNSSGGDRPYLSPELKSRLRIVAHTFGKRNEDADRATIRNLVDPDNPLLIKNAAFKLNSGFGKYEVDFLDYSIVSNVVSITRTSDKLSATNNDKIGQMLLYRSIADSSRPNTPTFKIKISNLTGSMRYHYIDESNTTIRSSINITSDGVYDLPESKNTLFNGTTSVNIGFAIDSGGSVTIEQIPSLEDSFISDGVNDIIESTKTFAETFGEDCKEFTIVSMIRLIKIADTNPENGFTNYFRNGNNYTRNNVTNANKTGIYGYYANLNNQTFTIVDYVLGDKNDYKVNVYTPNGSITNAKFTPIGYIGSDGTLNELRLSAYTFTIGAIGKLTEDDINQIIGYYNLDRTVKADIYCNITKQGITNENHADFNDKLIDYSGNGRDIQLNNIAWNKESGIDDDGALRLDGVNDFGKVTGMPIYKDYTVVADYQRVGEIVEGKAGSSLASKSASVGNGAFLFNIVNTDTKTATYSFGEPTSLSMKDYQKCIYYQSKYVNNGKNINSGTGIDYDSMWLGVNRDNSTPYFSGAIYSLMSFPYSMSKFLIERQLKKHKLGTLYPNQVEFRPIIPEDENITKIDYFAVNSGTWTVIKPGDYVDVGARIVLNVYTKLPYKIEKASSLAFTEMSIRHSPTELNIFDVGGYIKDKTPQKIKFTLAVNEDIVQLNPIITANANYKIHYYLIDSNNVWKSIKTGDYITIGAKLAFQITFDNDASELKEVVSSQLSDIVIEKRLSASGYNIYSTINSESPQNINIAIDEYIRFEDIVQPYPLFFEFTDENGNLISWGGKAKVGSTITRTKGVAYANLLEGLFTITNQRLNGVLLSSFQHVVEKSMVFTCTATWTFDNNEPKVILSPSRLRIPNSSYKLLGYIPDISGHGNHGVIHNSAYAGMSGANGYGTNLGNWAINSANTGKMITQRKEYLEYEVLRADRNILFYNTKIENDTFVIYTSVNTNIVYSKESDIIANIPANTPTKVVCPKIGTILLKTNEAPTVGNIITVKQDGIYEGAYCFDGVDDFVTIPTVTGGKQVLMKVNWQKSPALLYDQRASGSFAVITTKEDDAVNSRIAYQGRNQNGKTYIDGIENNNIETYTLKDITHNITIADSSSGYVVVPTIGCNTGKTSSFAQMALYDFMLFDEISTDEEILTLNYYIGIEPKEGLLQPSITVNNSYVVLDTVEDTNDYLVNGTANCGIGFSDESGSKQFSTGVTYDKNFSYTIIVIANNNKKLISLSHNGVSADSIQSIDYSETTKLYICSTTNGMFAVGSAPQEIIIELSD